jgi:TolB protein
VRVSNSLGVDGHPQFTPDGNTVVYQSDRAGHPQLFVQGIGSPTATQLTQEPAANTLATVSPDGATIAFVSTRDGGASIWLMGLDGSNQRPFTKSTGTYWSTSPHFLHDGTLAYLLEGKENGRTVTEVVRADLPTGHVTTLTSGDLLLADFAAAPAGDALALVVPVQGGGKSLFHIYLQVLGNPSGPVPVPAGAGEQLLTPAFMP